MSDQINAGASLIREFDHYAPVKVAFWLKTTEEFAEWDLYIAAETVDESNFVAAYRELGRIRRQIQSPDLDVSHIKVIYGKSLLAQAAAEIHSRYPGQVGIRLRNQPLGDLWAAAMYLYPTPVLAAT